MAKKFERCDLDLQRLEHPTPRDVRDYIVECFLQAQRDVLEKTARKMGLHPTEEKLRQQVVAMVRTAFREAGGDFEAPTAETIRGAIQVLARKARSWGTPEENIQHHIDQFRAALEKLD